jgi:PAS domain-containing protein
VGQTLEYRIRHKNGTWRVLKSTASVIRDAKGAPEKFVIVNRDITERKSAQEALRLADADFKSVVEDAPYGIYRANCDGQLFRVNPALQKMLRYGSSPELLIMSASTDFFALARWF